MSPIPKRLIGSVMYRKIPLIERKAIAGRMVFEGGIHHQEVSALPVSRQDVGHWIERSFGDLVGH